jgi:hypothetical protein
MKKSKLTLAMVATAALMAGMTLTPMGVRQANAQISLHFGWQQPPQEYNDVQRNGFHAGVEAARHDIDRGLPPDADRHGDFRHPHLPRGPREDFRRGFRHGYEMAYNHRADWNRDHHDWGR